MKNVSLLGGLGLLLGLLITAVGLADNNFEGKGPAGCTDKRCWQAAVSASVNACRASGCSTCSQSTSAGDSCKFDNGYTCWSTCKSASPPAPSNALTATAAPEASGKTIDLKCGAGQVIAIQDGSYGANCKVKPGNVTPQLATACNGKNTCSYKVDHTVIGDPAFGCAKDYKATYSCVAAPTAGAPAASPCQTIPGEGCYWMQAQAPNCWVKSPVPAGDRAACMKLDSCSPEGGKASGGGCYKWAASSDGPILPPPSPCKVIAGPGCFWMQSQAPYCWVPSPMSAPTPEACLRLDSCSPQGGKASGGGCYKWSTSSDK